MYAMSMRSTIQTIITSVSFSTITLLLELKICHSETIKLMEEINIL